VWGTAPGGGTATRNRVVGPRAATSHDPFVRAGTIAVRGTGAGALATKSSELSHGDGTLPDFPDRWSRRPVRQEQWSLEPEPSAPAPARRLIGDFVSALDVDRELIDFAALLANEIVTNAVLHAHTTFLHRPTRRAVEGS
jgi:hypothetical protein